MCVLLPVFCTAQYHWPETPELICFTTGSLYLLTSSTHFCLPPTPYLWQPPISSLYLQAFLSVLYFFSDLHINEIIRYLSLRSDFSSLLRLSTYVYIPLYSTNTGDLGLIPGLGISPREGKGHSLPCSDLENSVVCIVPGVAKSWTRLSEFNFKVHKYIHIFVWIYVYSYIYLWIYAYIWIYIFT